MTLAGVLLIDTFGLYIQCPVLQLHAGLGDWRGFDVPTTLCLQSHNNSYQCRACHQCCARGANKMFEKLQCFTLVA